MDMIFFFGEFDTALRAIINWRELARPLIQLAKKRATYCCFYQRPCWLLKGASSCHQNCIRSKCPPRQGDPNQYKCQLPRPVHVVLPDFSRCDQSCSILADTSPWQSHSITNTNIRNLPWARCSDPLMGIALRRGAWCLSL